MNTMILTQASAVNVRIDAGARTPIATNDTRDDASFGAQLTHRLAAQDDLRVAAEQLVATTFIEPVLALARESNAAEGPFAPGPAERRFGMLIDQYLADDIVRSANFPLVGQIERQLMRFVEESKEDTASTERTSP